MKNDNNVPVNRYDSLDSWKLVDKYFSEALVQEDDALIDARESGVSTTMPNAEVSSTQGALLGILTQIRNATRVLEFGTLAGYSTIHFARSVGRNGKVITFELEEQNAQIAKKNLEQAGIFNRVEIVVGTAIDSANRLIENNEPPFDIVFIDADKPNNPKYLEAAIKLTKPGSLILIDNVVRNGEVINQNSDDPRVQGVRNVIDDINKNKNLKATALQTVGEKGWDGLIFIYREH
ncbi:O-methyltransferase [Mammaliicoccus sciuri]|uniref:O-methyltransferase n=1 Tax=Mammaliicoccus sciuri TaxID=1296 RepID=UPI001C636A16|nr:O-methyltransferase [Mammaliicoccus sciuri]MCD8798110.1 O-methyltransferase [Mammaliicoccus sciuri]QYG32545.1 O-methyltransferase [Mammaliicoccus sciuri]